jgi:penicillin-binding protein 1A
MIDASPAVNAPSRWAWLRRRSRRRTVVLALLGALFIVALIPPLRRAASVGLSRVILFVASPLAPSTKGFDTFPAGTQVLAADGSPLGTIESEHREPVQLKDLPPIVPEAVLAAEDEHFYEHSGVEPASVFRAAIHTVTGRGTQGGSTITQQLAKLNYTNGQRTLLRKLKEVLYASKLEQRYSKNQLLERYLNQVYFGDGAYGIDAAARRTFGVPANQLDAVQAATLAGRIRAPGKPLDPRAHPDAARTRRNQVLANMARNKWLAKSDLSGDEAAPLGVIPIPPSSQAGGVDPYFVNLVAREAGGLAELGDSPETRASALANQGLTIESTLDPKALAAATKSVQAQLGKPGDPSTSIASVQPGDGAIRLLFGGLDPNVQFDVASQGHRQPGSSFKPFVYLAALDQGIDPRTTFDSGSPKTLQFEGSSYPVTNAEPGPGGPITVDQATVESVNVVYAQLVLQVGPQKVADLLKRFGFSEKFEALPSIALGGVRTGVSPLEQAAAYAAFAAKGAYATPYSIVRIKDRNGKVIYSHGPTATTKAVDATKAGVLNATLERVVGEGTGKGAAIGRPVAGKTGTTTNFVDAWFVGYTPQLATAVWVGDPDKSTPMTAVHGKSVFGGTFPATIFADTMKAALSGQPPLPLFTANPDQLNLRPTTTVAPSTVTTVYSPPAPAVTTPPFTGIVTEPTVAPAPGAPFPTVPPQPPATVPPRCPTTTTRPAVSPSTTAPPSTTTTTRAPPGC